MKTKLLMFIALIGLVATGGLSPGAATADGGGRAGTTLTATKTAAGHLAYIFDWTIDKSVTPDTWDLFRGDSGTSQYTITVTKAGPRLVAYIDGQVCVRNGGSVATEDLQIVDVLTKPPSKTALDTETVDVSSNPVLDPGETGCYDYRVDVPPESLVPGATYKDTANVTITNQSGHLGDPFGPGPSATTSLPTTVGEVINDTITVDDTNGGSFAFSDSGSVSYSETFTCDGDAGTQDNTATIQETGQSDSASVTVNCYALEVRKDAFTSFRRFYSWSIDKSADQSEVTLPIDQALLVNYSVEINVTGFTDSTWTVSGNISVHNPAPVTATLNSVSDVISGVGPASVFCGVSFPYTLPAGGTLDCTYEQDLPDGSNRTNTATASLQNYSYDYQMNATPSGTSDFSGSAAVDFGAASVTEVDECVDVSDTHAGSLGAVCYPDVPKLFEYSRLFSFLSGGTFTFDNTASFVTNDTGATGSASSTVIVHVVDD